MDPRKATIRFSGFAELSAAEMLLLRDLGGPVRRLSRGDVVRREGDLAPRMYLLREGWTVSSIEGAAGRQIIKVNMPGDMLGMPALALKHAPDTITALTDIALSTIELAALTRLFAESPRLSALLFLISQEERVMLMDRLTALGRASADVRLASLILQLYERWLRNNPDADTRFPLPLTRRDIADLAGVSPVHVSRVTARLRRAGIVSLHNKGVEILDLDALEAIAATPPRALDTEPSWVPASG